MSALPTPFFLDLPGGRRFAVHHAPSGAVDTWGQILKFLDEQIGK